MSGKAFGAFRRQRRKSGGAAARLEPKVHFRRTRSPDWRGALSFTRSFANVAFSVMADACLDSDLAESASTLQDFDSGQCFRRVS
jgi:hypothetical protein